MTQKDRDDEFASTGFDTTVHWHYYCDSARHPKKKVGPPGPEKPFSSLNVDEITCISCLDNIAKLGRQAERKAILLSAQEGLALRKEDP